jgi:membrane-bound lytic murein transglycosylase D
MSPKDPLSVGKTLVIWTKPSYTAPPSEGAVIRKVAYKVRSGDSLAKIAGKFRVEIQDIARWNKINIEKYLQPGQALVLFVNVKNG